jgi:hypothetical protein
MSDISFWDVIIWTFWLMLLATWLAMAFLIVREVLSDGAMNGAAKAVWIMFVILVPWLGALTYIYTRGGATSRRPVPRARRNEQAPRS